MLDWPGAYTKMLDWPGVLPNLLSSRLCPCCGLRPSTGWQPSFFRLRVRFFLHPVSDLPRAEHLHRRPRGAELLRTTARTFHVATPLCLRRSYRRVPTCGVRISRLLPACVRRKQAQHPSCPCRTRGGVFGRCRCAPRPDPVGRGSRWLAKLTTACPPQDRARLPVRQQATPGGFDAFSF